MIAVVAAIPRIRSTGHMTVDETLWIDRTTRFGDAITTWNPARASATNDGVATMPGVTTMWVGNIARVLHSAARSIGLVSQDSDFATSPSGILFAEVCMAVLSSILIGLLVWVVWRWLGPLAAVATGMLLATEPFLVGHGAVLHTDELTALFGALAVASFGVLYGYGDDPPRHVDRWAVFFGATTALAALTKMSAAMVLAPLAILGIIAIVRDLRRRRGHWLHAPAVRGTIVAAGTFAALVLALWPALWADTSNQIELLRRSAKLAEGGHDNFFQGQPTSSPGPTFYWVATPLRMTPWFLAATVLLAPLALFDRHRQRQVLVLISTFTFSAVVLTLSSKKLDRYVLPILPLLAMMVGVGLAYLWELIRPRLSADRRLPTAVAGIACAAMVLHAIWITPWSLLYFNPAVGGSARAERTVVVGWGEGLDQAFTFIRAREGAEVCARINVDSSYDRLAERFECGGKPLPGEPSSYRVIYINHTQRGLGYPQGKLVGTVVIRGLPIARVYDLRLPDDPDADPGS